MEREESFDSFYRATRRQVLHQAFALTGDLLAAQSAVRDAYVGAWHHWRKVAPLDDPLSWVRPHAWQLAQRRHAGRIWHRNKGLAEEHLAVLDALSKLPSPQRRALLLIQLAEISLDQAARELGVTLEVAERNLQSATATLSRLLDVDSVRLRTRLLALDAAVDAVALPRPSIVRRAGQKRRQANTVVAAIVATAVAIVTGAVAYEPGPVEPDPAEDLLAGQTAEPDEEPTLPTADNLLDNDQIRRLGESRPWKVVATHNNTAGDGINSICQQERFADPDGLAALVRAFEANGKVERRAVQTVEVSASKAQAKDAFNTTLGWYAGCQVARLQLLEAYRVDNIGSEASVLMIRVWERPVTTYSVGIARIGAVVTTTVGRTVGAEPPPAKEITQSLADSVAMLCARSGSKGCAKRPTFRVVPPPPSGEEPGILAVADLPPVGKINEPWVGTEATPARQNPSATTCDRADFAKAGADRTRTRTFLIPQAKLPARFGLSETYGVFDSARAARRFLDRVRSRVAGCEDRDLATTVTDSRRGSTRESDMDWTSWNLRTEISEREAVGFRVGFVRVGSRVAQLTFVSAPRDDMSGDHFRKLLTRAGDRLRELG